MLLLDNICLPPEEVGGVWGALWNHLQDSPQLMIMKLKLDRDHNFHGLQTRGSTADHSSRLPSPLEPRQKIRSV